jgi:hypothetical protein|tara:strand:- start:2955 stop:3407 length:453 start_codon:yes stop_codon:yes gene_type:complete
MVLIVIASFVAGCTVPGPDEYFNGDDDDVIVPVGWLNLTGEFTVMFNTGNETNPDLNATTAPIVMVGSNSTWLEVSSYNYTATHLSFDIINNTVIFNNFTFDNPGYLLQDGIMLSSGYAPNYGEAELYFPDFPYDVTINYTVIYREWNGR